ncbi:HAD family hydrolase [Leekyejoonella antrihumi]|uniref:HAD family hydrolase n=1 Tax=Leekyejoonella antrihumi TaxID=1660198 RepID=UPI0016451555|nr:HAD family hydrolase [Leekyejoonella antrihumi]
MSGRAVAGVLLDLDDTLIDTTAALVAAGAVAMAALWPDAPTDVHRAAARLYRDDPAGLFRRFMQGEITFEQMRAVRLTAVCDKFSLDPVEDAGPRYDTAFAPAFRAAYGEPGRLFEDAVPLIERIRAQGTPVGLLTNSNDDFTKAKLEATGLAGRFDCVVTRDALGFGKPDPRVFHHTCQLIGIDPGRSTYIGDDLHADALGAAAAGMTGIWLNRTSGGVDSKVAFDRAPAAAEIPAHIRVVETLTEV